MPEGYSDMNARTYRPLTQSEVMSIRISFAENQRIILSLAMILIYLLTLLFNLRLQSQLNALNDLR